MRALRHNAPQACFREGQSASVTTSVYGHEQQAKRKTVDDERALSLPFFVNKKMFQNLSAFDSFFSGAGYFHVILRLLKRAGSGLLPACCKVSFGNYMFGVLIQPVNPELLNIEDYVVYALHVAYDRAAVRDGERIVGWCNRRGWTVALLV